MNYTEAIQAAENGRFIRHGEWPEGQYARMATDADMDYFPFAEDSSFLDGALVFDCPKPMDCRVSICSPTEIEKQSNNWQVKS